MPLAYHDPNRRLSHCSMFCSHLRDALSNCHRAEAGVHASLRTRCVDTGRMGPQSCDGSRNIDASEAAPTRSIREPKHTKSRIQDPFSLLSERTGRQHSRVRNKVYRGCPWILCERQEVLSNDGPMLTVKIGHYVIAGRHESHEIHPFHIHQVHFLVYEENGKKTAQPEWLDTVNVAPEVQSI